LAVAIIGLVRTPRIKLSSDEEEAVYHCISRTVNKEYLFGDTDKEVMRRQLWQVVDFCGVKLITYTLLSNHFHIHVRVPKRTPITDQELLRRYRVLHPHPTKYQTLRIAVIESWLAKNDPEGEAWRQRMLKLMGDVSAFMKLFKMRYSIWYNQTHNRCGPLWSDRFKSVLGEASKEILQCTAVYIDLNSIRANLVDDPKDYRFCGYAEAVAGNEHLREQLALVVGGRNWAETQDIYRLLLFSVGTIPKENKTCISMEAFEKVVAEGGKIALGDLMRHRVKYMTEGAVLGSRIFVEKHLEAYRQKTGRRRNTPVRMLPPIEGVGVIAFLRGVRGPAIG